jgi:hypothetical protein
LIENPFSQAHTKKDFLKNFFFQKSPKIISSKTLRSGISEIDPCVRLKWFEKYFNEMLRSLHLVSTFWSLTINGYRADVYLPSYRLWLLIVGLKNNEISHKRFMKPEKLSRVRFVSNFYIQTKKTKKKHETKTHAARSHIVLITLSFVTLSKQYFTIHHKKEVKWTWTLRSMRIRN